MEFFEKGKLIDKQYFDETGLQQKDTTNKDRAAQFPGGEEKWKKYLNKKLYFPEQYKITNADKLEVVVTFTINEQGEVVDPYLSTLIIPEFIKIALKTLKKSPKWLPAIDHNRKLKSTFNQPIAKTKSE